MFSTCRSPPVTSVKYPAQTHASEKQVNHCDGVVFKMAESPCIVLIDCISLSAQRDTLGRNRPTLRVCAVCAVCSVPGSYLEIGSCFGLRIYGMI